MQLFHPLLRDEEKRINVLGFHPIVGSFNAARNRFRCARESLQDFANSQTRYEENEGLNNKHYRIRATYYKNHVARGIVELTVIGILFLVIYDIAKARVLSYAVHAPAPRYRHETDFTLFQALHITYHFSRIFQDQQYWPERGIQFDHPELGTLDEDQSHRFNYIKHDRLRELFTAFAYQKGFTVRYNLESGRVYLAR